MQTTRQTIGATSRAIAIVAALLPWFCLPAQSLAQEGSHKRGFSPGNSFSIGDIETINTTNGNLMLRFPLGTLPAGRNGLSAGINVFFNSKLYDSETQWFVDPNGSCNMVGDAGDAIMVCPYYQKSVLKESPQGGWQIGNMYTLTLLDRHDQFSNVPQELKPQCWNSNWQSYNPGYYEMRYHYKLMLNFPDGSSHEMRPNGWSDGNFNDPLGDWFDIRPDGYWDDCINQQWYQNTITYYSVDGSFLRLDIQHDGNTAGAWMDNPWTLYFPDGSKVTSNQPNNEPQRFYDRNNNYLEFLGSEVRDQFNRSVGLSSGWENGLPVWTVTSQGFDQTLTWTIRWKWISVLKNYWPCAQSLNCPPDVQQQEPYGYARLVIDTITMPAQAGGLAYHFQYNAPNHVPGQSLSPSLGWGEISGITLPSGAQVNYTWAQDGTPIANFTPDILRNAPISKVLTYDQEYDGQATPSTETWTYDINPSGGSVVTAPDGGVTTTGFVDPSAPFWNAGLNLVTIGPDGTKTETIWDKSILGASNANPYPKTVFTSIRNASGTYVKTAIRDYKYDKNGNVTRVADYDWVNYGDVPRSFGMPTGLPAGSPTRVTVNAYFNSTPDASESAGSNTNVYWSSGSPRVKNAIASTEIRKVLSGGAEVAVNRTEYTYDNPSVPANMTQVRSWDSTKGAYSNPLTTGNSLAATTQYNQYGMPTLITDAGGLKTLMTYGAIGTAADLYTTQIKTAYQTAQERTESREYHLATGLVTRVTDVDNNVSTATTFDVLGRPTLVSAAEGKSEETRTAYEYSEQLRRVITRSDLTTLGDGKLVSIQHYDQLGRVRLSRQLEDASTQSATDETKGIKVQTRYRFSGANSYALVSNAYRADNSAAASGEPTMGWTRSKADNAGRIIEVQTFGGAGLPAPWNSNTTSTGTVLTAYDGVYTTVTDQAGRVRRSQVDGLGRLIRVDEPSDATNTLGGQDSPTQATNYQYDSLNNLTLVTQGNQTRSFSYSSLGRLTSASNPESGVIDYEYDPNGYLTKKTEPRLVPNTSTRRAITYVYDPLGRVTARNYNDGTPNVSYSYDATNVAFSRGRLTEVNSSVSSYSYDEYDPLGRVKTGTQATDGQAYTMSYQYNRAGAITSQTYPSGRVVKTDYDGAGRIAGVKNNATGFYYAGAASTDAANRLQYSVHGAIQAMKLGNGLWEHINFNSRLQVTQIGLGTSSTDSSKLKLDYTYGVLPAKNNGNIESQTITLPGLVLTQSYTYDELNRLKSAQEMNGSTQVWKQTFSYDRFGNRRFDADNTTLPQITPQNQASTNPAISSADNRITAAGYRYDLAGNLECDPGHPCGSAAPFPTYYEYDGDNRITTANEGALNYIYDGDGRRVKKIVGGPTTVTTVFVYDIAGQLIAEYCDQQQTGGGTSYLTADHLGTPRVITRADGSVSGRHDYQPFGEEIPASYGGRVSIQGYPPSDGLRQKFTLYERDDETGLDFAQARYYSSDQGRFTSIDPYNPILHSEDETAFKTYLAEPQKWNRYTYVLNSPLRYVDPFGEDILLTGSEEDQKRGLNRLRNQLGEERFNLLDFTQQYVEGVGNVTVLNFGSEENRAKFEAIGGDDLNERQYSSTMADIIGSNQHVEYRVAVHFSYKGIGIGKWRENVKTNVYAYGGAATVDTDESWTGNVQIFIAPDATYKAFENMAIDHKNGIKKSNDGDLLTFTQEQIDAHEFGHAWSRIKLGLPVSRPGRALRMENIMRIRQKSTNIRIAH